MKDDNSVSKWFKETLKECEKDPAFHAMTALLDLEEKIIKAHGQPKGIYRILFLLLDWFGDKLIWRKQKDERQKGKTGQASHKAGNKEGRYLLK